MAPPRKFSARAHTFEIGSCSNVRNHDGTAVQGVRRNHIEQAIDTQARGLVVRTRNAELQTGVQTHGGVRGKWRERVLQAVAEWADTGDGDGGYRRRSHNLQFGLHFGQGVARGIRKRKTRGDLLSREQRVLYRRVSGIYTQQHRPTQMRH